MRRRFAILLRIAIVILISFAHASSGNLSGTPFPTAVASGIYGAPSAAPDDLYRARAFRAVKRDGRHDRTQTDRKQDRQKNHPNADRQRKDQHKSRKHDRKEKSDLSAGNLVGDETGHINFEDRYIVVLDDATADAQVAAADLATDGVVPIHVYQDVFAGFAAVIPDHQLDVISSDPRVDAVVPDREVHASEQILPTGIDRIDADLNPTAQIDGNDERVDVDVAVLDTGIASHPDLAIAGGVSCIQGDTSFADGHGHGTHVAGTIGALDNNSGVVGVAPGARLWAVKVLNAQGKGSWSSVICGLNWVAANSETIDVANMSLGGDGSDSSCGQNDPLHDAICRVVVESGIPVVVAAGNDADDAANHTPAAYDEVITVSALADSDGRAGGLGAQTASGPDDSLATFSDFGADVDIAAPGASILSTVPGGYAKFSGTSMASPHVAGAAALFLANNRGADPAQVKAALLDNRELGGLRNDPDGIDEGVLNFNADPGPPAPPLPVPIPPSASDSPSLPVVDNASRATETIEKGKKGKKKQSAHKNKNNKKKKGH